MNLEEYYGLVLFLARRKHSRLQQGGARLDVEELVQEGFLGLLDAARRFDASRGVAFSTFAYPRILGAIDDYLRRLDTLPSRQRQRLRVVEKTRERLAQTLGREPREDEVAEQAKISAEEIRRLISGWTGSLAEQPCSDSVLDSERSELAEAVQDCLQTALDEQERRVLVLRTRDELTLQVVGEILGRPLQSIHNVEVRARRKVRECLERKGWDLTDVG